MQCSVRNIRVNDRGKGSINCLSQPRGPCPDYYWVFEYQLIASGILTQLSRYNRAKKQFASRRKGPQHWIQLVILIIYLYIYFTRLPIRKNISFVKEFCDKNTIRFLENRLKLYDGCFWNVNFTDLLIYTY